MAVLLELPLLQPIFWFSGNSLLNYQSKSENNLRDIKWKEDYFFNLYSFMSCANLKKLYREECTEDKVSLFSEFLGVPEYYGLSQNKQLDKLLLYSKPFFNPLYLPQFTFFEIIVCLARRHTVYLVVEYCSV